MTQRNGAKSSGDGRLLTEASKALELSKGMEHQEAWEANDCEFEEGGQGRQSRSTEAAADTGPDGGWGWVVLVATIMVLALTLGFPSCVGIFYTDLQNEFHATNSETSWVPSIMTSVLHAGGKARRAGNCSSSGLKSSLEDVILKNCSINQRG